MAKELFIPVVMGQFNHVPDESREISHRYPSLTVPDQAFSIAELLERHQKGLLTDLAIGRTPIYSKDAHFDDQDMEKLMDSDIVDRMEFVNAGKAVVEAERAAKAKSEREAAEKRESAEFQAKLDAAVADRLKAAGGPVT